ncbi:MAG: hypothetical protein U1E26_08385 [Coriobacteriia bacterium]|nr:hypothetical protein [Coriobacteriia bacterium]
MKLLSRTFARVVRASLALALALPAFAAQPAIAVTAPVAFQTDNGSYVANDHTPIAFRIVASTTPTTLTPNGVYRARARFLKNGTDAAATNRGFTWNGVTKAWAGIDADWSELPTITASSTGLISGGDAGWVWAKFGDERESGAYSLQVLLQEVATPSDISTSSLAPMTVLDMDTNGAFVHNAVTTGFAADKRAELTAEAATATVYSLSKTEPNLIDSDSDGVVDGEAWGPAGTLPEYRLAAPMSLPMNVLVNRTRAISSYTAAVADVDIAMGAADMVAPTRPGAPTAAPSKTDITVNWTASSDASSAVRYLVYKWKDALAGAKSTPVKSLVTSQTGTSYTDAATSDGDVYNYEIRAVDASSNVSARSTTVASRIDTIAPALTATNNGNTSATSFSLVATDGALGSGVKNIQYSILTGAARTATVTASAATTITSTVTTVGAHTLFWLTEDNAGNVREGSQAFSVVADTAGPSVVATLTGTNTANAVFQISATDAGRGVSGLQYRLNPTPGTTVTVPGPSFTATRAISAPGTYSASWIASDVVGNSATGTLTFAVVSSDTVPPVTTAATIPAGWSTTPVTVTLSAVDTGTAVASTHYRLNGGSTLTYTAPLTFSTDGTTTLEYWSVDTAWPANTEATKTATIRVDRTSPVVGAVGQSAAGTATASASPSDATSGIDWTRYRVNGGVLTTGTTVSVTTPGTSTVDFVASDKAGNTATETVNAVVTEQPTLTRRATSSLTIGTRAAVVGTLTAPTLSTAGVQVRVEYLKDATWVPYTGATAVTAADGTYRLYFNPTRNLRLRIAFLGAGALAQATSPEYSLRVKAKINLRSVATQRASRPFYAYATLAPAHQSYVYFRVYKKIGSTYRLYRTVRVKSGLTFRARLSLPAGLYRIQASHSDATHISSVSASRYFRVR